MYKNFLVEIGTEELPSRILRSLIESFYTNLITELDNVGIVYNKAEWFATSRRLALKITNLIIFQSDAKCKQTINSTFNNKERLIKKIRYQEPNLDAITKQGKFLTTNMDGLLSCRYNTKRKNIEALLSRITTTSLEKLSIYKLMRWGISDIYFIRPVHTVTLLLDDKVISTNVFGVQSNRIIYGHRFMGDKKITINNANQYPQILLERGNVVADYEMRKNRIKNDIEKAAHKINGRVDINEVLLEEITALVEWPVILIAKFATRFLIIPKEALICVLKNNQKCFPIYTMDGKLLPNFIFVANIESSDPQQIISGYERVMHSRLADAEFFFNNDRKRSLEANLPYLESMIFQQQLGTIRDKTNRITKLSSWIAQKIGANINHATRASLLSKCDLVTSMVLEFPETQGIIGMYYALQDGEEEDVAIALSEQYRPRFSGDKLPSSLVSCTLAIADKMDTLVGIFGINQQPKSNKDPFSLRRTALGVLRIIIDKKLDFDLQTLIKEIVYLYNGKLTNTNVVNDVINFMFKRLCVWYQKDYSANIIKAVLACYPTSPIDFDARVRALSYFLTLKKSHLLIKINKRIVNILTKSDEILNDIVCFSMLKEISEIKLANSLIIIHDKLQLYLSNGNYQEALIELTTLYEVINEFFENVMVNVEDKKIRNNRLTLLFNLRKLFLRIADVSLLNNELTIK